MGIVLIVLTFRKAVELLPHPLGDPPGVASGGQLAFETFRPVPHISTLFGENDCVVAISCYSLRPCSDVLEAPRMVGQRH
jgi:hypothetical protein